MRTTLTALSICALLTACKDPVKDNENKKDLLPTNMVNNPRSAMGTDTAALNSMSNMTFADSLYDFGTINEGEVMTHEFAFTNTGRSPLIISSASGSCGCTVADFPHEPVLPGKQGTMTVRFNSAGKPGHQEKSVTIKTNSIRGTHMLFIKGEVKETK